MRRNLSAEEKANFAEIGRSGVDVAYLFLTRTGLSKGYVDATLPVRTLLSEERIHDFAGQEQGPEYKVTLRSKFLLDADVRDVQTTMYRPNTKKGDPRIGFSRLARIAEPGDVLCLFVYEDVLHVVNLTQSRLAVDRPNGNANAAGDYLDSIEHETTAVARDLLAELRKIAAVPLRAVAAGDHAVGRTIEMALGLRPNARKTPDYKGIELKSTRAAIKGACVLFSQAPEWRLGPLRSNKDLLRAFGAPDDTGVLALRCSVFYGKANPSGLKLEFVPPRLLQQNKSGSDLFVAWRLTKLHQRLRQKHRQTFWIKARSEFLNGVEYFHLDQVRHTHGPSVAQFDALIESRRIWCDYTLHEETKAGRTKARDHGYLFKVRTSSLEQLFPGKPVVYGLT